MINYQTLSRVAIVIFLGWVFWGVHITLAATDNLHVHLFISNDTVSQTGSVAVVPVVPTISLDRTTARVIWHTNAMTRYVLRWGQTSSYELGTISSSLYKTNHATTINQLESGTQYFYELTAVTGTGFTKVIAVGVFTTQAASVMNILPNVSMITAHSHGTHVDLSWHNPVFSSFAKVRILRSSLFYPQNPYDGVLVYDGASETVTDWNALMGSSTQYYTFFVYDTSGIVSSGAVTRVLPLVSISSSTDGMLGEFGTTSQPTSIGSIEVGDNRILSAVDVFISQDGRREQSLNQAVTVRSDLPYTLFIAKTAVPPHLKSIIVTIENPTNQHLTSSYLLRLNLKNNQYITMIPPPNIEGQARLTVEVFDYQAATIRRISNQINFVVPITETVFSLNQVIHWGRRLFEVIIIGFGLIIYILWRRHHRRRY